MSVQRRGSFLVPGILVAAVGCGELEQPATGGREEALDNPSYRHPRFDEVANLRVGADPAGVAPFVPEVYELVARARDPNTTDQLTYGVDVFGPDGDWRPAADLGVTLEHVRSADEPVARITIAPDAADVGIWKLRLHVDDRDGGFDWQDVSVSVGTFINRSPRLVAGVSTELVVGAGTFVHVPFTASEPDPGQTLSIALRGAPPGAHVSPTSGITWTPDLDDLGDHTFYLQVTDDGTPPITEAVRLTAYVLDQGADVPPRLVSVTPNTGDVAGGTEITLRGRFGDLRSVWIGGLECPFARIDPVTVTCVTPAPFGPTGAFGGRDVAVLNDRGSDTVQNGFRYATPDAPSVTMAPVNGSNAAAAALTIGGLVGGAVEYLVSDGQAAVTGTATIGWDGSVVVPVDVSSLADGQLTATAAVRNGGGVRSAATTASTSKDTLGPALTLPGDLLIAAPGPDGATVGYAVSASEGTATCTPPSGSQFPLGATIVTCTATDAAGNPSTGTFTIRVQWSWSGLTAPIVDGGTYRLGRTLPLKFALIGASSGTTDLVATLQLAKLDDQVAGPPIDASEPGTADSGNQFRYDAASGQYIFNLSTRELTEGTWRLSIALGDGVSHCVTISLTH